MGSVATCLLCIIKRRADQLLHFPVRTAQGFADCGPLQDACGGLWALLRNKFPIDPRQMTAYTESAIRGD